MCVQPQVSRPLLMGELAQALNPVGNEFDEKNEVESRTSETCHPILG